MTETDLGADLEPDIETRAARIAVHLSAHELVEKVATRKTTLCCFEEPKQPRGTEDFGYYLAPIIKNFYSSLVRMGRASDDGHSILKSTKYTKNMPITLEKAAEQAAKITISFFQRKNTTQEHLKGLEIMEATYAQVVKVEKIGDKMMDASIKSTNKEVGQAMHDKLISGRNLYYETKRPEVLAAKKQQIQETKKAKKKLDYVYDSQTAEWYWRWVRVSPTEADITLILENNWNGLSEDEKENWVAVAREEMAHAKETEGRAAMRAEMETAYKKAKEAKEKPMVGGEGDEDKMRVVDKLLCKLNKELRVAEGVEGPTDVENERILSKLRRAVLMLKHAKIQITQDPHQEDNAKILELQWKRLRAGHPRHANLRNELTELLTENYQVHPDVVTALMNGVDFNHTDIVFTKKEIDELRVLLRSAAVDSIEWQVDAQWRVLLAGREPIKGVEEKLLQLNLLIKQLNAAYLNATDNEYHDISSKLEFAKLVVQKKKAEIRIDTLKKMQVLRREDNITRFLNDLKTNASELDQQIRRYNKFTRDDLTFLPYYDVQTKMLSILLDEVDFTEEEERRLRVQGSEEAERRRRHLQAESEAKAKEAEVARKREEAGEARRREEARETKRREEAGAAYRLKAAAETEWNKAEIAATEKVKIRLLNMFKDLKNLENQVNISRESNKTIVKQQKRAVRAAVHASVHVLVAAEAAEEAYQVTAATKAYHVMEHDNTDKRKFNGCTTHRDAIENFLQAAIAGVAPAASAMATKILAFRVLYEYNRSEPLVNRVAAALFIVEAIKHANTEAKAATVAAEETYNAFNVALEAATSAVNDSFSAFTKAVEAEDAAFDCAVKAEEAQFPAKTPNVNYKQQVQKMMDLVTRARQMVVPMAIAETTNRWDKLIYSGLLTKNDVLVEGQKKAVEKAEAEAKVKAQTIFNTLGTRLFEKMVLEEAWVEVVSAKSEYNLADLRRGFKLLPDESKNAEEEEEAIEVAEKEEGVKYREKVNNMATALFNLQLARSQRNIFIATNHGYINNVEKGKDDKYNDIAEELKIHNDNVKNYKEKFQTIKENTGTTKYTDTVKWMPAPIRPRTARILPKFFSWTGGSNKKTKRKRKTKRKKQNKRKTKRKKQNKRKTKRKRKSIKRR